MRRKPLVPLALALASAALGLSAACSSPSDPPLGGPYGGTTTARPPGGSSGGATGSSGGGSTGSSSGSASSSGAGSSSGSFGGPGDAAAAMTWTQLWNKYMAASGVAGCAKSGCHSTPDQCDAPSDCYTWLVSYAYIAGGINDNDLFSWTPGGFMPQGGPTSLPDAVTDYANWTAAGSPNN